MKTWLTLLGLLLSLSAAIHGQPLEVKDGVVIQKIGKAYIYLFPSTQGRITAFERPAGRITVGKTITIVYALKVTRGKARFIGMDASPVAEAIDPKLRVESAPSDTFGFMIEDKTQPLLKLHIKSSFMRDRVDVLSKEKLKEKTAREGNLSVVFGQNAKGQVQVLSATVE